MAYLKLYATNPGFIPDAAQEERIVDFLNGCFEEDPEIDCNTYQTPVPVTDGADARCIFEISFFEQAQVLSATQLETLGELAGIAFAQCVVEED